MSANSSPAPELTSSEDVLRTAFIEMLFALAVSQVAIELSDVISATTKNAPPKYYCVVHLAVSLLLIAASWVGWRQSVSPGMKSKVKRLFSLAFIGLLIDVILVLLYFILVKAAEIGAKNGEPVLMSPTAHPEAFWVCIIFLVYAIWDFFADVLEDGCRAPRPVGAGKSRLDICPTVVRVSFVSMFASVVCLLLSTVALLLSRNATGGHVLFIDMMLCAVVVFFRAIKGLEAILAPIMRVDHCKAFSTQRPVSKRDWFWGIAMLVIYLVGFCAVCEWKTAGVWSRLNPLPWGSLLPP